MRRIFLSKQRGISLLELILSLLVIAAILFLVTRYFQSTNENLRVSQAVDMINTTVDASYTWVEGQPDFSSVSISKLIDAGLLPTNYGSNNANPWQGGIKVRAAPPPNNSGIIVELSNLTQQGCNALVQKTQKFTTAHCEPGFIYSGIF